VRVLIADDHPLIRDAIRHALAADDGMEVVGEACEGGEVLSLVARTQPDAVLLDVRMPNLDGLACLDRIRRRHPSVKVVMLSALDDERQIAAALRRGAVGYILKTIDALDLPSALRQLVLPSVYHALRVVDDREAPKGRLTARELHILKAVARGLSNHAVAGELWVTEQTVKFHLTNVYRKLGVASRTEAARYAHERGLVEYGSETAEG
jgi:DNA-binding NarL/FixJ family response regulator